MRGNDARLPQSVLFSRVPLGVAHSLGGIHRVFLRSEEHTSELQSRLHLVCRLLLEKKNEPSTFSESAINLCAAMAGSEHGDARRAVDLLRIAGDVGERVGLQTIHDTCVRKAADKMDHDRIEEAVRSLPLQNKVILLAVSRFIGGTNTGEVYLAYSSIVKKTSTELLTQRRVSGILAEL